MGKCPYNEAAPALTAPAAKVRTRGRSLLTRSRAHLSASVWALPLEHELLCILLRVGSLSSEAQFSSSGSQSQIPTYLSDAKPCLYTGWLMSPAEWTAGLIPALPHSPKLSRWLPGNGISVPCMPCSCGSFSFWPPNHTVVSQVEDCVSRLGGN